MKGSKKDQLLCYEGAKKPGHQIRLSSQEAPMIDRKERKQW